MVQIQHKSNSKLSTSVGPMILFFKTLKVNSHKLLVTYWNFLPCADATVPKHIAQAIMAFSSKRRLYSPSIVAASGT